MYVHLRYVCVLATFGSTAAFGEGTHHHAHAAPASPASLRPSAELATAALPPLPPGVESLRFNEFFEQPVGPRGLAVSDRLQQLDGRRVRILGYMVEQDQPAPRCLLLSPFPVTLHEDEWGFCEDLPATLVHVFVDQSAAERVSFTPGPLLLTGILSVGPRAESDQRVSLVRLQLDAPARPAAASSSLTATAHFAQISSTSCTP